MKRITKGGRRYETPCAGRDRPAVRRSGVSDHGERRCRGGESGESPRRRKSGHGHGHGGRDLRPDDGPRRSEGAETGRSRGPRGEVLRVPRRDPGAENRREAREGQLHELPRRDGGSPEGQRQAAGDPRRPRDVRRLPPGPVRELRDPEFEEACAHGEVAPHGARPEPVLGQADDGARLHEGARQPAQPRLHARRPPDRRPGVRRAVPGEGRVGVRLHAGAGERVGRAGRPVPGQQGAQGVPPGERRGGEPDLPAVQDAGQDPPVEVHGGQGRSGEVEPRFERGGVREGTEHGDELLHVPRPARGEAPDRPGRPDPGADPSGEGHALAQGRRRRRRST